MDNILDMLKELFATNGLITAFLSVGLCAVFSGFISKNLFKGRIHSSAIAIMLALIFAGIAGAFTDGGSGGISDVYIFSGMSVLGGSMLRDFTIISTANGASLSEFKKCGKVGILSLFIGIFISYIAGCIIAILFGYTDSESIATIGAGSVTYIVGPVTGTSLGADSTVIALSVAAGLVKSVLVMIITPLTAKKVNLTTPKAAMIYGGLMGTTSGVAAGLAATDQALVPYGAMTSTFFTGLGCLLCPSVLYSLTNLIF